MMRYAILLAELELGREFVSVQEDIQFKRKNPDTYPPVYASLDKLLPLWKVVSSFEDLFNHS